MSRLFKILGLFLMVIAAWTARARAADREWDNDLGDYDFAKSANWSDDTYPNATSDNAIIQNYGYADVVSAAGDVYKLYIGSSYGFGGQGTINVKTSGSLTVKNNFYVADGTSNQGNVNITGGTLSVAGSGGAYLGNSADSKGYLDISGGTFQLTYSGTSRLAVSNGQGSVGVVRQTGGTVVIGGTAWLRIGNNIPNAMTGEGGYGYYKISGSESTINANGIMVGNGYTSGISHLGVLEQSGGTINVTAYMPVGNSGSAIGLYNLTGGTMNSPEIRSASSGTNDTVWGQINVSGTGTQMTTGILKVGGNKSKGYFNLAAGAVLTAREVYTTAVAANGGEGVFNFHGGTLKAGADTADVLNPATHFMRMPATEGGVFLGPEGGTIDTDGYNVVISEPLQALTGWGVGGVTLSSSGSGYDGPPIVRVTGGTGRGATAIATVSGGEVTAITVTNPGTGYQEDDVLVAELLRGGPGVTAATVSAVALTPSAVDGGLVKAGLGRLTLAGNNTYAGRTKVEAGTLALTGSLVGNVDVQVGATLAGDGGVIGGGVDLKGTLAVEYDGDTDTISLLEIAGELDIAGATFSFSNAGTDTLAAGDYVFATYGSLVGAPAIHDGLLPGWSVDYTYDYNGGTDNSIAIIVSTVPLIPGDTNGDSIVDATDAKKLASNWGAQIAGGAIVGDFNNDGWVNAADASIMAANWGYSSTGRGEGVVPEPSSLALLVTAVLAMLVIRRRS
ncbi:MAG TPA: hypothetical protein DD670_08475 [Planctomycetaceae bacterium]|nr:hypothetical protein [Planctomycetaceae bacterium]